jgi:hypothetical protein
VVETVVERAASTTVEAALSAADNISSSSLDVFRT